MTEHRWYTDPLEPGAPQVGDLVVAVGQWGTNWHRSWIGRADTHWSPAAGGLRDVSPVDGDILQAIRSRERPPCAQAGCPSCQEPTTIQWPPVITPAPGNVHGSPCEHAPHT